jgi:hypothetical protein
MVSGPVKAGFETLRKHMYPVETYVASFMQNVPTYIPTYVFYLHSLKKG